MNRHSFAVPAFALILTACAAPPLLVDSSHPASVNAPEASAKPFHNPLGGDPATRRTQLLLAERAREANAAEAETPSDQTDLRSKTAPTTSDTTPNPSPGKLPGGHEHHD